MKPEIIHSVRPVYSEVLELSNDELRQAFFEIEQYRMGEGFPKGGIVRTLHPKINARAFAPIQEMPWAICHEIARRQFGGHAG